MPSRLFFIPSEIWWQPDGVLDDPGALQGGLWSGHSSSSEEEELEEEEEDEEVEVEVELLVKADVDKEIRPKGRWWCGLSGFDRPS